MPVKPQLLAALVALSTISACSESGGVLEPPPPPRVEEPDNPGNTSVFQAEVARTAGGSIHIAGLNFSDLGYGLGYAQAQDQLCTLAELFTTVSGTRSFFFGEHGDYELAENGTFPTNLNSDFYYRWLFDPERIESYRTNQPTEIRALVAGYVRAYNRYVREWTANDHPGRHADCDDGRQRWVRQITDADIYRAALNYQTLSGMGRFINEIAEAQPPNAPADPPNRVPLPSFAGEVERTHAFAFAGATTNTGRAMLVSAHHQPLTGLYPMWQAELRVDEEMSVNGAMPLGIPFLTTGATQSHAFVLASAESYGFTPYELTLTENNPAAYVISGTPELMKTTTVKVDIQLDNGVPATVERTFYESRHGPIFGWTVNGQNIMPWTEETAYAIRDANYEHDTFLIHLLELNRAPDAGRAIQQAERFRGAPNQATIIASAAPNAPVYYGLLARVPDLSQDTIDACQRPKTEDIATIARNLPVLDGAQRDCEWSTSNTFSGTIRTVDLPRQTRIDYVQSCGDSHWLATLAAPQTGFKPLLGPEQSQRSGTGRLCLQTAEELLNGPEITFEALQSLALSGRTMTGPLHRDEVIDLYCNSLLPLVASNGREVDSTAACAALADWDLSSDIEATGALVWWEFWNRLDPFNPALYQTPFDPSDPINTPANLQGNNAALRTALADAIQAVENSNREVDDPLFDAQRENRLGLSLAMPGAPRNVGGFQLTQAHDFNRLRQGVYDVYSVPAYLQVASWPAAGLRLETMLGQSQSRDPEHAFSTDRTTRFYGLSIWGEQPSFVVNQVQYPEQRDYYLLAEFEDGTESEIPRDPGAVPETCPHPTDPENNPPSSEYCEEAG